LPGSPQLTEIGLRIVDVLADQWGHAGDDQGRVIWFEVTAKHEPGTVAG
jgi:hypothetical protein